jgi:hypothetical protein
LSIWKNFFYNIKKKTVLVLDNAGVHKSRSMPERIPFRHAAVIVYHFPASISSAFEYYGNGMAKVKKEWMTPEVIWKKTDSFMLLTDGWLLWERMSVSSFVILYNLPLVSH